MAKVSKVTGLRTLSRSGSLIFCENCDKILGSINKYGSKYIYLSIDCNCENIGKAEIYSKDCTLDPSKRIGKMPAEINGVAVCKKCGTQLFNVIDDRVRNYSFYVECSCGERYDLKPSSPKRLGETVKILKKK